MDQLHRPQMAWRIIVAIGILTLFSILIQYLVTRYIPDNNAYFFRHHIFNAIISFSAMIVVYRIDYSLIGKYSKWIATIFLLFFAFQIFIVEMRLNGTLYMRILSKVLIMSPLFFCTCRFSAQSYISIEERAGALFQKFSFGWLFRFFNAGCRISG